MMPTGCPTIQINSVTTYRELAPVPQVEDPILQNVPNS